MDICTYVQPERERESGSMCGRAGLELERELHKKTRVKAEHIYID